MSRVAIPAEMSSDVEPAKMSGDTTEVSSAETSGASSLASSAASSLESSVTSAASLGDNTTSPPLLPSSSKESQHQVDPKAPGKSDGSLDDAELNVPELTKSELTDRFAALYKNFALGEIRTKEIVFDADDKAKFLIQSMKSLQWINEAVTALKPEPEAPKPDVVPTARQIATPEAKYLTWKEWKYPSDGADEPHSALYILSEEPPSLSGSTTMPPMRKSEATTLVHDVHNTDPRAPPPGHTGAKQLPPRIRIVSRAARDILDTICDDRLNWSDRYGLVLLRPYKLLTYHDQNIRKRLSELEKACSDHLKQLADEEEAEAEPASLFTVDGKHIFQTGTNWSVLNLKQKEEAARDMRVVVSFMDEYLSPLAASTLLSTADSLFCFNELWHLFTPGRLVYVRDRTVPQKIWRVLQGSGGRRPLSAMLDSSRDELALGYRLLREKCNPLKLDCYYIDYNGAHFVRVIRTFTIEEFPDAQPAKSLQILPMSIAVQEGLVKESDLMKRGEAFMKCATVPFKYMYYRGRSLSHAPNGNVLTRPDPGNLGSIAALSEAIESPVVVDFERCLQSIPDWSPTKSTVELSKGPENEVKGSFPDDNLEDDRVWDVRMIEEMLEFTDPAQRLDKYDRRPIGWELLLLPDRVFAFVLRTRRWACLQLGCDDSDPPQEKLKEVPPKKEAWDDLKINPNHKSIVESLMRSHFEKSKSKRRQFDLIQDKGKGLIILLHGVPGVGKTSTAETVAEFYGKPLLPITCGDLGLTAPEVEANLQNSFQLAESWECVLLLDEADVFLAERSRDNVERNALVSVFLRVLEYYEGVLFLTTNKVGSFDEAFKSRISVALYYPPLSLEQTLAIWKTQMDRTRRNSRAVAPIDPTQHIDFEEDDIKFFASTLWNQQDQIPQFKPTWNGRQIRNAFQTAVALAEVQRQEGAGIKVTRSHFERVSQVSNEFNFYLYRTKLQRGDDVLNLKKGFRDDTFQGAVPSAYLNDGYTNVAAMATMQQYTPEAAAAPAAPSPSIPQWGGHQQDVNGQPAQTMNDPFMSGLPALGARPPSRPQPPYAPSGYQPHQAPASGYSQYNQPQPPPTGYGNAGRENFAGGAAAGAALAALQQQGQNQDLPPQPPYYNYPSYPGPQIPQGPQGLQRPQGP